MKRPLLRPLTHLVLAALLACASGASQAHRFHAGIAEIAFNQQSGSVEVVHTYMAHDIEALIARLGKRQVDLTSADDEALLRKYIDERFYLLDAAGKRLPLKWVGITARVDSIVVYQELENTPMSALATVHNAVLMDVLPRQANTVNVRADGAIRSLAFSTKSPQRRIR